MQAKCGPLISVLLFYTKQFKLLFLRTAVISAGHLSSRTNNEQKLRTLSLHNAMDFVKTKVAESAYHQHGLHHISSNYESSISLRFRQDYVTPYFLGFFSSLSDCFVAFCADIQIALCIFVFLKNLIFGGYTRQEAIRKMDKKTKMYKALSCSVCGLLFGASLEPFFKNRNPQLGWFSVWRLRVKTETIGCMDASLLTNAEAEPSFLDYVYVCSGLCETEKT